MTEENPATQKQTEADSALLDAVYEGNIEAARKAVASGAAIDGFDYHDITPLMTAIENGHPEVALFLVEAGANPNTPDSDGVTPLIAAVQAGHVPLMKALIAKGADVNAQDNLGWTALMCMVSTTPYFGKDEEVATLLLENGADAFIADREGFTALSLARDLDKNNVVRIITSFPDDQRRKKEKEAEDAKEVIVRAEIRARQQRLREMARKKNFKPNKP